MANSVPMPSSGHQGVNDRALQEGVLEDKFGAFGGKQVDQRWLLSLSLILRLYLFSSMEELSRTEEIVLGGSGLILLVPSHFTKYTLSKL